MKLSLTALILTLFALGSTGVFAQGQQQQQPGMEMQGKEFSELDQNQDGNLTQDEAQQAGIETVTFEAMDQDGDQQVSEEEFQQAKEGGGAR
jgi:hypothetical protein